jgi:predicted ferric reductase
VGGTYSKVFHDGKKTRTELGWWSNRIGSLAFALTPLTLVLSTRDNLFSLITGIPYQHFNFMHRALGRIIFVQSLIHTIGWTIIQGHFYEPATQPAYLAKQWQERYYKWGFIAQMLLALVWVGSLSPVIRWIGHEAFRKSHYFFGILFLGGCWGHWPEMKEWMIASIAVVFFDRFCRLARMMLLHFNLKSADGGIGFKTAAAVPLLYTDEDLVAVVALRVKSKRLGWRAGQHFFLTFPSITLLQSHPFTPAVVRGDEQLYLIVGMAGETARLVTAAKEAPEAQLPVILCGAYGSPVLDRGAENFLLVAGGTGVSFTLPLAEELINATAKPAGKLHFVWIIRREQNVEWIRQELLELVKKAAERRVELEVVVYVTRDSAKDKEMGEKECGLGGLGSTVFARPRCEDVVREFVDATAGKGRSQVLASGPMSMGAELRSAVAEVNDAGRVWKGDQTADVGIYWDARYL